MGSNGKKMRRGSDIITTFPLSEEGKYHFTDVLGIKTEIELRKETSGTASAAGDRVAYNQFARLLRWEDTLPSASMMAARLR